VTDSHLLAELLGSSPAFEEVKDRARQMLARAGSGGRLPPVLIQGETGSGKGLLARALHHASARAAAPFVAVNCGAIPETLGESEFFGFARGAHSEARHPKIGFFQAADRGMIFLDEVGLLSEGHQARLLKVVEDRQVIPVGSTKPIPVDVWLISATNADLWADVQEHRFRRDLYERLAVITFTLPPLRGRPGDIVGLAQRFLARSCADYGLQPKTLAPDAQRRLLDHPWPGNIRELSNVIERASLLVEADIISADRLELTSPILVSLSPPAPSVSRADKREHIAEALQRQGGNITRAAADVGVSRKTLRDWMKQKGLYPPTASLDLSLSGRGSEADAQGMVGLAGALGEFESAPRPMEGGAPPPSSGPTLPQTLPRDKADIHWERRWITLLRVSLAVENDERVRDTIKPLEIVAQKVQMFGGRVIELGQNSLEAAFGLDPLEDAAQRAAYAALAIQRAGARAREEWSPIPVSRIALHADPYLVGRIGTLIQIDQDAKQAASALLATLVAAAPPNAAMVSRTVLQLLRRRFDFDGPVAVGGDAKAYRLLGRADRPALFDRQISFFVGRDAEIELLQNRWDLATQGHGQIVGIVGDAGVGKSRLVWEFLHGGASRQGLILETASAALGRPTPFSAILELLRAYFGVEAGEADAVIREKIARRLADLDQVLVSSLPAFLSLFDLPTGDVTWEGLDPTRRRKQTFDAIKRLMLRESARQPLLLLFEDAHWADSETKALLEIVADSLPAARVLVLVTFRPEYEHEWGRRSFYTQLRVDPLWGEGVQRFLSDLLGDHSSLSSLRARLIEWTEGNPFFLEETIWTLAETKALEGKRGAYRMLHPITSIAVPESVHEVLAARMSRLAPSAHEVLQSAAAVGRRVPHAVLAGMSVASGEALSQSLELLRAREFLTENVLADEREYAFRHALTQEVAYASLPDDQRRGLHARILDAIERAYPDRLDDMVADLAHHAFEGQRWERAVEYLRRAGMRAFARSANTEAAACYEQALVALAHLPARRENQERAIDLRFDLRNALTPLAQAHRTLEHLREAAKLAGLIGDERRRGRALSFAANSLCIVADYQGALEAGQQARQHAKSLGDFALGVASGMYLGRACAGLGQYRRAADVLTEVAESLVGDRAHDYLGLPVLPAVFSRSHLALSLAELGEFDEAERCAREAIEIAESTRQPDTLLWAYVGAGVARLGRGQVAPATIALEHAMELCRTADMPVYLSLVGSPLGLAYGMSGRVAEGLALVEQAAERAEARRQIALLPWTLLRLGEVRLLADKPSEAGEVEARALALFREHGERGGEAYALRAHADVALRRGDVEGADARFGEAGVLVELTGMRPLAARCRLGIGLTTAARGRVAESRLHLAAAAAVFHQMGMEHWEPHAREALARLTS
jgi:transcriptional regulator with AAA-type ATPase domain/tetratricopeptide (TPR) repeat protein